MTLYKYPIRGEREDGAQHFSEVRSNRTRGNRDKLEYGKFLSDSRNPFLNMRVIQYFNSGPALHSSRHSKLDWSFEQPDLISSVSSRDLD